MGLPGSSGGAGGCSFFQTLQGRPSFDQRAVHREVVVAHEAFLIGLPQHFLKEQRYLSIDETPSVLGEGRRIPDFIARSQAHEPPVQQVVVQFLY